MRVYLFVFRLCLCCFMVGYPSFWERVCAQGMPVASTCDSLQIVLQQTQGDTKKMGTLKLLAHLNEQRPEELLYTKQLMEIARKTDSVKVLYDCYFIFCRYYFVANETDSLLYWRSKLDSVATLHQEYPEWLFHAGNLVCRKYLDDESYELAMNEALQQLSLAEKHLDPVGMLIAKQDLGLIYQAVKRDTEAITAFNEGLKWLDEWSTNPYLAMSYLSDMVVSTLRVHDFQLAEKLLEQYYRVYTRESKEGILDEQPYPLKRHEWMIHAFCAELYARKGELSKAEESLKKARQVIKSEADSTKMFPYYQAQAFYYQQKKDYPSALQAIKKALSLKSDLVMMKREVEILRLLGQNKQAVVQYKKLLKRNSEVSNDAFSRQIKQLRILNDKNDRNEQRRALLYQNEQLAVRQQLLIFSSIFSLILLYMLYSLVRYYKRTSDLRDELLSEKVSLIASERLLQAAKEEAELANQKKTAFIANISHEVRTPLNAIVGFSELLSEEDTLSMLTEEEKQEFTSSINRNSEALMSLVNDVLDLSRLESENFHFTFTNRDAISCCYQLVEEALPWAAKGVLITFDTVAETSYPFQTDINRFRQLLSKLLKNAAKFTSQGEIHLAFQPGERELRFIVTDTGCGIPLEKQEHVFERFEKLDDFTPGTGLGLSICRLIANKLGGSLTIDPLYTHGSRFIFVHPMLDNNSHDNNQHS